MEKVGGRHERLVPVNKLIHVISRLNTPPYHYQPRFSCTLVSNTKHRLFSSLFLMQITCTYKKKYEFLDPLFSSFGPIFSSFGPTFLSLGPTFSSCGPTFSSLGPTYSSLGPTFLVSEAVQIWFKSIHLRYLCEDWIRFEDFIVVCISLCIVEQKGKKWAQKKKILV